MLTSHGVYQGPSSVPVAVRSLDEVHREARKVLVELQSALQQAEQQQHHAQLATKGALKDLGVATLTAEALEAPRLKLQQLELVTAELSQLAERAPAAQRALWQRRALQLETQHRELSGLWRQVYAAERQRQWHLRERESLLEGAEQHRSKSKADATIVDLEQLATQSLEHASHSADGILGSGRDVLNALRQQHQTLKAVRRKTLDMAHRLGLSQSLIRRVQQRARNDMRIVCGGLAAILALVCLLFYVKHYLM